VAYAGVTKLLIIAPAWVGDMVMAHSLIRLLAQRHHLESQVTRSSTQAALADGELPADDAKYPEIHVVAPPATAPVGERMAEVHQVHVADFVHGQLGWQARKALGRTLSAHRFSQAYVLPNSWKSALVPWFAGVAKRTGWSGEARYGLLNDRRKLNKEALPLMIERFMALAYPPNSALDEPYPLPQLQFDADNRAHLLERHELTLGQVTVLCPGAEFGAAKKWPHYAAVAQDRLAAGGQVWLMGSPKDEQDCARIAEQASGAINLAGKTSLLDAIDLLSLADVVVCNDSGLMHVACALGRPTVGIFGSTSPGFTPPLGESAVVVERELDCRPCFERTCPLGHLDCLQKLDPQQVIARLPHSSAAQHHA